MCALYELKLAAEKLAKGLNIAQLPPEPLPELFTGRPSHQMPIVRADAPDALSLARWGLLTPWAKEEKEGNKLFNARAETLAEKPSFAKPLAAGQRCLIPLTSFTEWLTGQDGGKQPYQVSAEDEALFTVAGLYTLWKHPQTGVAVPSYTMVTTAANAQMKWLHNRMPLVLTPAVRSLWLAQSADPKEISLLLQGEVAQPLVFEPMALPEKPDKRGKPDKGDGQLDLFA